MRIPIHNLPSTAGPIHRRTHPPPHPSTAALIHRRTHPPPHSSTAAFIHRRTHPPSHPSTAASIHCRIHPLSHPSTVASIHRRSHPPATSSTAALIYRPTHPSLVSRSQARLVNMLDNCRSSKEGALTARRFSSILSPSYRCHEWNHRISRAGAREETRIRKLRDFDVEEGELFLTHLLAAMPGDADEGRKQQHRHTRRGRV
jgi:hypothetical protein